MGASLSSITPEIFQIFFSGSHSHAWLYCLYYKPWKLFDILEQMKKFEEAERERREAEEAAETARREAEEREGEAKRSRHDNIMLISTVIMWDMAMLTLSPRIVPVKNMALMIGSIFMIESIVMSQAAYMSEAQVPEIIVRVAEWGYFKASNNCKEVVFQDFVLSCVTHFMCFLC